MNDWVWMRAKDGRDIPLFKAENQHRAFHHMAVLNDAMYDFITTDHGMPYFSGPAPTEEQIRIANEGRDFDV